MIIRPLTRADYDQWLSLWNINCLHKISDDVTTETWRRLTHPKEQVYGLGAFDGDNTLKGFLHYILHPTTGFKEPACYMQDLFVTESSRRQGIAKRLLWELHNLGKKQHWARIYWFGENDNTLTQNLYKNLGIKMDFSLFMLKTGN